MTVGRCECAVDVAAHGDRRQTIAAPDDAVFEAVVDIGDLAQRHRLARRGRHREIFQQRQLRAFGRRSAQRDFDELIALAVIRHRHARQRTLQEIGEILRTHAEHARAFLIDIELHRFARLFPIRVHIAHMWILPHHVGDFAGDPAHRRNVGTGHAELHRITDRRAVFQAQHACAQFAEIVIEQREQIGAQFFAVFEIFRQQHEFREARLRQLLIERQIKTRCAGADVADVVFELWTLRQPRFELLGLLLRRRERRTFRQLQIDQQLEPRRIGKKLLLDETEADDRHHEQQHGRCDHGFAMIDAPADQSAKTVVETRVVRIVIVAALAARVPAAPFFGKQIREAFAQQPRRGCR